ncbi:mannan polymerase I complex VAN1 subunit (M-pol I subunit VAN1) [Yamadazyma tenuis ATCC 10573]|uniref:Mannan polymerase I complex VAN1 subunit (M-pol I subunit VAN1) n=1 Tax=Candida tenuis (strain ATCC 10573 / BCRC 21748 / CBS 615 / JCM 9827 / NBRC 10315 / NRRL Y-1498 / VKM Y-70) TaxID=590646 RepID=G3B0X8_CANTC|nr:mannan polymerase I complex VAN1 subunit (M-pol I subunit VAN1) [Yamadazyma tenuis ATCC 10573]EGV64833.1 mannan polymerase I complex VAN1 subunit (M-pol I subunit VAN1) [Yamadazyma tenuis ATCC 10573]
MGQQFNSELPVHHRFSPKKNVLIITTKRLLVGITALVVLFLLVGNGSKVIPELQAQEIDTQIIDNNLEKVYEVTKDGVAERSAGPDFEYYDLNSFTGSAQGMKNQDVVLFLMPLRNAEHVLSMAFHNIMNLTYDHSLIDIAFLVSDCSEGDTTLEKTFEYSVALQNGTLVDKLQREEAIKAKYRRGSSDLYQLYMDQDYMNNVRKSYNPRYYHKDYSKPFRSITIYRKDFGQAIGQGFSDRHAVKVQGIRRKLMGRARNWLTTNALKPYHSWVYWRDVDIETCPGSVIQDLMKHDYDVMVPNVWRPLPSFLVDEPPFEQPYDLNSWIESDPALELASKLDEDDVIVEGYAEYPTWRVHLAYIRDRNGDPNEAVDLDGVGGVSILAKAKLFRQGVHFPAFTFLNHAETEAFGKMSKKMGFRVGGLPHYTIWHIYEPSEDDLMKIAKLERKKRRQKQTKNP